MTFKALIWFWFQSARNIYVLPLDSCLLLDLEFIKCRLVKLAFPNPVPIVNTAQCSRS